MSKELAKEIAIQTTKQVLGNSTDRPWQASPSVKADCIYLDDGGQIAAKVEGFPDHPHNMANAELIVRAVNSYEAMRAALNAALNWFSPPNDSKTAFPAKEIAEALALSELGRPGDR